MEETITTYGKDTLTQLFAILPPLYLIMTVVTSWIFLPFDKNLKIKSELFIHLGVAVFWSIFALWLEPETFLTKQGVASMIIAFAIASVFNIKFRVRLFNRKKK